jgi:hypothetical protein
MASGHTGNVYTAFQPVANPFRIPCFAELPKSLPALSCPLEALFRYRFG